MKCDLQINNRQKISKFNKYNIRGMNDKIVWNWRWEKKRENFISRTCLQILFKDTKEIKLKTCLFTISLFAQFAQFSFIPKLSYQYKNNIPHVRVFDVILQNIIFLSPSNSPNEQYVRRH